MDGFSRPVRKLHSALLSRTALATLDETSEPRVANGLNWLVSRQVPLGGFGSGGAAETALSVLAVTAWRPEWVGSDSHALACTYLEDKIDSGEALETLWDEAVVLRVLITSTDPATRGRAIERAIAMMRRVSADHLPHHIAQALSLAYEAGLPTDEIERLMDGVDIDSVGANAYVRGQVLWAKVAAAMPVSSWRNDERWLIAWIKTIDPTKGNFQDFCAALVGLAKAGTDESQAQVRARVDMLFDTKFQRRTDGSWYHFAWETSWALLALSAVNGASRVVLSTPDLLSLLADAARSADELDEASEAYVASAAGPSFWWTVVWSGLIGITSSIAVALTAFIFRTPGDLWATLGNISLVWGPTVAVIIFCARRLHVIKKRLARLDD